MNLIDQIWPSPVPKVSDDELLANLEASGRPWLRVNFVSSVDGAVTVDDLSGGLSGAADKRVFELLRRVSDVVLVGAGTVRAEGYGPVRVSEESARWRVARGRAAHPVFAIVSGSLNLDPTSRIFTDAPVRPILVTTEVSSAERRAQFESVADVVVAGATSVDVRAMIAALAQRGLRQVLSEGGPSLFGSLLAADIVDELCITISPLLAAGDAHRIATGAIDHPRAMVLEQALVSDGTLMLRYRRFRPE